MTILFDLDDVIWSLNEPWVNAINRKYGTSVKPSDITSWKIEHFFPTLAKSCVFSPLYQEGFYDKLRVRDGCADLLDDLLWAGETVKVVTTTDLRVVPQKMEALFSQVPSLDTGDIIIAQDKSLIHGDVIVDDNILNLKKSPCQHKLLYTAPYNETFDTEANGMVRVNNWSDIRSFIIKIKRTGGNPYGL